MIKKLMVSSSWAFLAFPFQGLAGMLSVWGWYISNLSEFTAPQLHGSQSISLPSSWQSSLRFYKDLLWFSQKHFLKILVFFFFFKNSWHFFTPKGFFFLLPTWNTVLSERVSDWVKALQFLLHCGTPGPQKELSWSLMFPGWCVKSWSKDHQCLSLQDYSWATTWLLQRNDTLLFNILLFNISLLIAR